MPRYIAFALTLLSIVPAAWSAIQGTENLRGPSASALPALRSALDRIGPQAPSIRLGVTSGPAESFAIRKNGRDVIVEGADHTGLGYAIHEVAAQLAVSGQVKEVRRTPEVEVRSVALFLYNRDLEQEWYYSEDFWRRYFALLARARFNRLSLVFGHQTSYFAPLFPFMVEVPGYEHVKVPSLTAADRRRNLDMLRRITEIADEHGIRFVLGIWQQHAFLYGKNLVDGLPYKDLFDYCPKALAIILKAVPKIHGVQFRMNIESGIEEDDQNRFYTAVSKAIVSVGRPIAIDYRAKGLRAETIASAVSLGIRPTVSTKYWREHMGLPYQSTRVDAPDKARSYRRYGYWDTLFQGRPYDVLHRMWTLGSHKILLWGSFDYARQFAVSSHLGEGRGLEICASLSQKGFGNYPGGNWRILAKPELEYYRWEFERYWAYYLNFGLAAYSGDAAQPVLDAEYQKRFGKAGASIRKAYESASWVIPYLTATRSVSNSNFGYWPEMDAGGLTQRYIETVTGDDNRFYRINEYVDDVLAQRLTAKITPLAMASQLERWAEGALAIGDPDVPAESRKELASTRVDFGVLAGLARYHAARMRSATQYEFFQRTGERNRLTSAIAHFREALEHWRRISQLTDGFYNPNMVFNRPPEQIGHWKDELPFLENELDRLIEVEKVYLAHTHEPDKVAAWKVEQPRRKLAMRWKESGGTLSRWADLTGEKESPDAAIDRYTQYSPRTAVQQVIARHRFARVLHAPIRTAPEGEPLRIHASIMGNLEHAQLAVHYRLAGQGFTFHQLDMTANSQNSFAAAIPAAKAGDKLFYYISVSDDASRNHGSAKEPHAVSIQPQSPRPPTVEHRDITSARVGTGLAVAATIRAATEPAAVRLHYRHHDQSEDFVVVDMLPAGNSRYSAKIPGEFVVPGWDLNYAIEVVDAAGTGVFYPDLARRNPFVVVTVQGSH